MKIVNRYTKLYIILSALILLFTVKSEGQIITLSPNATVSLKDGSVLQVNGGLEISSSAGLSQTGSGNIYISGDWTNNGGTFTPGSGTVTFLGSSNASINGTSLTEFYFLHILKNGVAGSDILTLIQNIQVNDDLLGEDGIFRINNGAVRSIEIFGDLIINSDGTFDLASTGSATHNLDLHGDVNNSGIIDLLGSSSVITSFVGVGNADVFGSGPTTEFSRITLSKTNPSDIVHIYPDNFNTQDQFLVLNTGVLRFGGTYSLTKSFFYSYASTPQIPSNVDLWIDNPNVTVTGQSGDLEIQGGLRLSNGTVNVGLASETAGGLIYSNGTGTPSLTVENGYLNINSELAKSAVASTIDFNQSGGEINIGVRGYLNTTHGMFDISSVGSEFIWTGGIIELNRTNRSVTFTDGDYIVGASSGTVTGGTLRIDAQESGNRVYEINTTQPVNEIFMTGTNDPVAQIINTDLTILDDLTIDGSGAGRFDANDYNINIGGDWFNNASTSFTAFAAGSGTVTFDGSADQLIGGTRSTTYNHVTVNKSAGDVILSNTDRETFIEGTLKLDPGSSGLAVIDLNQRDLIMGESASYVSNSGTSVFNFDTTKYIKNSESGGNYNGRLIKQTTSGITARTEMMFPVGTDTVYSPAEIVYLAGQATFGADAYTACKVIPIEHPRVEEPDISLMRYWQMATNDITLDSDLDGDVDVIFHYVGTDVAGNEGEYRVLFFSPSYPDPLGFWTVDPGGIGNDIVDFNNRMFYSLAVKKVDGDWLCGEEDAAQATYFSRQNGDYNDPDTWSKITFGGAASSTAPNKASDRVLIADNDTVTVTANPAEVDVCAVMEDGTLKIAGDYVFTGDTLRVDANGSLIIGNSDGVYLSPTAQGCVQTDFRIFNSNVIYTFIDAPVTKSGTGNALPTQLRSIVVDKSSGDTLLLEKQFAITDSLVLIDGALDVGSYSINGNSAGRTFSMYDGELIIRNQYPTNYLDNTFTAGRITFDGTGNATIPSSGSTPGVDQYYDLKISGQRDSTVITFQSAGQINIINDFDISTIVFTGGLSERFQTDGSTVNFAKSGGVQDIQCRPASPPDSIVNLEYFNLLITGTGTKQLYTAAGTPTFVVRNDLTLSSSTFSSNGYNLEVNGDWVNTGSLFDPGTDGVIMRSPVFSLTNTISSRDTSENPFYNLLIGGEGIVEPNDDLYVMNDFAIEANSNFSLSTTTFTLEGDWTNYGGSFSSASFSTVHFNGSSTQNMTKSDAGNEEFWDVFISNPNHVDATGIGTSSDNGFVINNYIELDGGNLITRGRHATSYGAIGRPGANPGHIDGELRKIMDTATTSEIFEVGYGSQYTPARLSFNGSGGSSGLVGVASDTITTATSPISWDNLNPDNILPAGSEMSLDKHVARQWTLSNPGGIFAIGSNRNYDFTGYFINPGDFRNGADPDYFELRLWNGSVWTAPDRFANPLTGTRNSDNSTYRMLEEFGTIILGEPDKYSFYSIYDANWGVNTSWSTQSYGGPASDIPPNTDCKVYIGDSKVITMEANKTNNGIVTIDTSGTLLCETYVLSGGVGSEFILGREGALGIGSADGIRASGAFGNIQTDSRDFNENTHNRGHFIYTSGLNQTQADEALPITIATLRVNKTSNTVTNNRSAIIITDSLHLENGTYEAGANISLLGNFYREDGSTFDPSTNSFTVEGTSGQFFTNSSTSLTIDFYNLQIEKEAGEGILTLNDNTPIKIENNLLFAPANESIIDGQGHSWNYVELPNGATLTRAGSGHIFGELRKYIPAGNTSDIDFEVGDTTFFTPLRFNFDDTGGTAGLIGVNSIQGAHPNMTDTDCPIDPARYIPRYWRTTRPGGSGFAVGTRSYTLRSTFIDPDDLGTIDHPTCTETGYWRGTTESWQALRPNTTNGNFAYACSDTRFILGDIDYDGSMTTNLANDIPSDSTLGSTYTFADGSLLLADYVVGNQNSGRTTIFYSRQDGDWTDPNTWSEDSYIGTASSRYPITQYDVAYIGNNRYVDLDANLGTNYLYSGVSNDYFGPAINVENTGELYLHNHVIRGVGFTAKKGSKVVIGSRDGITLSNTRGNIMSLTRTFEDSINVVYTAEGYTPRCKYGDQTGRNTQYYDVRDWYADSRYTERVTMQDASSDTIMDNQSGSDFRTRGYFYFADITATVTSGSQYRFFLEPDDNGSRRWKIYVDWNYDGDFSDSNEEWYDSYGSGTRNTGLLTVPASTNPGVTRIRVMNRYGSSDYNWYSRSLTGEVEDYTLVIINNTPAITQVTGDNLPDDLWSFEARAVRTAGGTIELGNDLRIRDSLLLTSGVFTVNGHDISLQGDFINDSTNNFIHDSQTITFYGSDNDTIRGTNPTDFYNIVIDKDSADVVLTHSTPDTDFYTTIENNLTFDSDTDFYLSNSSTITLLSSSNLNAGSGSFGRYRKFEVSGDTDAGIIEKQFTTAAGAKAFVFPVGIDTLYNPADLTLTGSYSGTPTINLQLHYGLHPARLDDNMLLKYWTVDLEDISSITANDFKFYWEDLDTNGVKDDYIPALHYSGGWEINLGIGPKALPSPIEITNSPLFEGDWTAGDANGFFNGRPFYSINTGDWDVPSNWSNISHVGPPSSYYPNQLYDHDSVYVDGYTITFNVDSSLVDLVDVGGTFGTNGELTFGSSPTEKKLTSSSTFTVYEDGILNGTTGSNRIDTLVLHGDFYNYAQSASSGIVELYSGANDYTVLKFDSPDSVSASGNTYIGGEGVWGDIGSYILDKNGGLADTLIVNSGTFADATVASPGDLVYYPEQGVLKLNVNNTLSVSNGNNPVQMSPFTGFDVAAGVVSSSSTLTTDVNTTIHVDGGDFLVGDAAGESLIYKTGTHFELIDGTLDIAGAFKKFNTNSLIDFSMTSVGAVRVLNQGVLSSSEIGFDITNASSSFSMDGGRIIIANGTVGANADFEVNAQNGTGMLGGEIQSGDGTTPGAAIIKIAGSMPVWDLHAVGNASTDVVTQITEETFYINNDLIIDNINTFETRGNTIDLSGDLLNSGVFDAINSADATSPRMLILSGSSNTQTLYNAQAGGLELYNLRVDKLGGDVLLGQAPGDNSNLLIRNILEFTNDNYSVIDSRTNGLYVEMEPDAGSVPQIIRNGLGHISGRLYRYVDTDEQSVAFAVGSSTVTEYRPVEFETVGSGGTAGLVGVIMHDFDHPRLGDALAKTDNNIQVYWNISEGTGFDLDTRTFDLKTYFLNPEDIRGAQSDTLFFGHFLYEPPCPDPPAVCPGGGTWHELISIDKGANYVRSTINDTFGDVMIAEADGVTFYSINDGNWNNAANWSTVGYESASNPYGRYPGEAGNTSDKARVGNDKKITVPVGILPNVRTLIVEMYNSQPGKLYIEGNVGAVRGISFALRDSCTLGIMHLNGIAQNGVTGGAILMDTREYGVSNYVFNSTFGSQNSGKGLPDSVAAIIVDNPSAPTNNVFVTAFNAGYDIRVRDSLSVLQGTLNCGNRDFHLYGDFSIFGNGLFEPLASSFEFSGPNSHTITLGNNQGLSFWNCNVRSDADVIVDPVTGYDTTTAHIYMENNLTFSGDNIFYVRDQWRKIIMSNTANVVQSVADQGYVDGTLLKYLGPNALTEFFEIGNGTAYTPVLLTLDNTSGNGTAGQVEAINIAPLPNDPSNYPAVGHRMDTGRSIPRYWRVMPTPGGSFAIGGRTANARLHFPNSELGIISVPNAVIRRRSIPTETPEWHQRSYTTQINWDVVSPTSWAELLPATPPWEGIGEFYIGEKFDRTFYSIADGVWADNNTWSLESHDGIAPPPGVYPNHDENEQADNVEIGLTSASYTHVVTLDVDSPDIDTLRVLGNSELYMDANTINCYDCLALSKGLFRFRDNATLSIGGTNNPNELVLKNFTAYDWTDAEGSNTTIKFTGTNTITQNPFGNATDIGYFGHVEVAEPGEKVINQALRIQGNLLITTGATLNVQNIDALKVNRNVINSASLNNNGVIEIGE